MTVGELGRRMDSAELSEWLAFEQEYGIPDAYLSTGLTCTVVARSMSGAKVGPDDFIPYFRPDPGRVRRMSTADMLARFHGIADAQNARQKDGA